MSAIIVNGTHEDLIKLMFNFYSFTEMACLLLFTLKSPASLSLSNACELNLVGLSLLF